MCQRHEKIQRANPPVSRPFLQVTQVYCDASSRTPCRSPPAWTADVPSPCRPGMLDPRLLANHDFMITSSIRTINLSKNSLQMFLKDARKCLVDAKFLAPRHPSTCWYIEIFQLVTSSNLIPFCQGTNEYAKSLGQVWAGVFIYI